METDQITGDTLFYADKFKAVDMGESSDAQWAWYTNLGSLTVLDRTTGYGNGMRDIETGYRDLDGKFWLASGHVDVRGSGKTTWNEAVQWVKDNANTCIGYQLAQGEG